MGDEWREVDGVEREDHDEIISALDEEITRQTEREQRLTAQAEAKGRAAALREAAQRMEDEQRALLEMIRHDPETRAAGRLTISALSDIKTSLLAASPAPAMPERAPGRCCDCGYSGPEETSCLVRVDATHCEHWQDGPDEDAMPERGEGGEGERETANWTLERDAVGFISGISRGGERTGDPLLFALARLAAADERAQIAMALSEDAVAMERHGDRHAAQFGEEADGTVGIRYESEIRSGLADWIERGGHWKPIVAFPAVPDPKGSS